MFIHRNSEWLNYPNFHWIILVTPLKLWGYPYIPQSRHFIPQFSPPWGPVTKEGVRLSPITGCNRDTVHVLQALFGSVCVVRNPSRKSEGSRDALSGSYTDTYTPRGSTPRHITPWHDLYWNYYPMNVLWCPGIEPRTTDYISANLTNWATHHIYS